MILPTFRARLPTLGTLSERFYLSLYNRQVTNLKYVQRFERHVTRYVGVPSLAFCNGQTALTTMLLAAGIGPGDEVIVPSFTFCGTIAAIRLIGATPVFAEIREDRLTVDYRDVAERMSETTRAILGVDVYGICCDYAHLSDIAECYRRPLLFDSAPSFGSMINAFPTGRYGTAQIFSLHISKPFTTMEGGLLCSKDPEFFERARQIRDFGQDDARNCNHVGLNGKMLEICGMIGVENLKDWPSYRHKRTFACFEFLTYLRRIKGIRTIELTDGQWPSWTYLPILVTEDFGKSRDAVLAHLQEKNIMARKYYTACHMMKPFANGQRLPITERIASQAIALPIYPDMTGEEMEYIADALKGSAQ
jgi:dTDP-4-amino-4,6-dideoxygalactose transaminase